MCAMRLCKQFDFGFAGMHNKITIQALTDHYVGPSDLSEVVTVRTPPVPPQPEVTVKEEKVYY